MHKELTNHRYAQAHLPFSNKLHDELYKSGYKMLYIHRHPLDVLVSLKNYILKKKNYPNHKMLKACTHDDDRYFLLLNGYDQGNNVDLMAPFFEKYARSISWSQAKWVCSITFEKIIGEKGGGSFADQKEELKKVLFYLNEGLDQIDDIQTKIFNPQSATFHKGIIGQWRNELSDEIIDYCKQKMKEAELNIDEYLFHK